MGLFIGPMIIVLLVVTGMTLIVMKPSALKKRSNTSKRRPVFFLMYASLLVAAFIISIVFPNPKLVSLKDYQGDYDGEVHFYAIMNNEQSIDSIASYKQSEENHPISGDTLEFNDSNLYEYYQTFNMLIVKDPSLTDTFTIETYETPYIYNRKDISAFVPSVEVNGGDGVVHLLFPEKSAVLNMYDLSFPFKQFAQDKEETGGWGSFQIKSDFLTIVYIPEDVTPDVIHLIENGDIHVEMIEKE